VHTGTAATASTRKTQYFEMAGHLGIYSDDWYANTIPPIGPWVVNAPYPNAPTGEHVCLKATAGSHPLLTYAPDFCNA
jgi:hypothetical protein